MGKLVFWKQLWLSLLQRNYLDVYVWENWGTSNIPALEQGQQFIPTDFYLREGRTEPPHLLTESELIGLMDKAGIGTDATMHDHIKKLIDRWFATKDERQQFTPTPLGEALVMGYDAIGYELWKPYLRAMMERDMKCVSDGTKSKQDILRTCLAEMKTVFQDARTKQEKLLDAAAMYFDRAEGAAEPRPVGAFVRSCPLCGTSNMVLKSRPDGKFMVGCLGFPNCRGVMWLPAALVDASVTEQTCQSCNPAAVNIQQV
ncbi:hypothetical protein CBR_g74 [Chara braunii]|uniref:DNA topoisomerase n=1 Tax=Chara braunii TaxID=69332 RepID=A0A388JLP9_CHABU|nr:hypothetical protein CBR_g74 [Chara braunii]|eukprot:GBG58673.1 hypothetical protein CBR_g74 [Chara braunii]